jgi:DNA-binding response OmpR family regulator
MIPSNGNDSPAVESLDLSGVRILVVEDSWHLGKALKGLLQDCGAEVAGPAATSADAQRLASEQPPDAALVDFSLRNDERADVLIERLNEQGIYVIVMSAHDLLPVAARRAAAILQKPFSLAALLNSLRLVVVRKESQKEQLTHG